MTGKEKMKQLHDMPFDDFIKAIINLGFCPGEFGIVDNCVEDAPCNTCWERCLGKEVEE